MPSLQLSGGPDQHDPLDDIMLDDGPPLTPLKVATPAGEICVNGELISRSDVDALEAGLRWIDRARAPHKQALKMLDIAESQIREAVRDLAKGKNKTQRIVGQNGSTLKVTLPNDGWDQAKLRAIWDEETEWRGRCLKVNEIGVVDKEWQKLKGVSDAPEGLRKFITRMLGAVVKAIQLPKVVIEDPNAGAIDVESVASLAPDG